MALHTIFGANKPPETQAIYNEPPSIRCATSFYLNQDRTGWQCVGGRYYVDPSLVSTLTGRAVQISIGNDTAAAISTAEIYPLVAGWNEVTWSTPLNVSPVKSPFWIWSEVLSGPGGTGNGDFLAFNPPYSSSVISATNALFQQSALGDAPARAAYSVNGGPFFSNPSSNFYSMDAIVLAPNEAPVVDITATLTEMRLIDTTTLDANLIDDEPGATFAWTIVSGPSTSSSQFSATNTETVVFDPTALGTYVIRVTCTDAKGVIDTDDITISVITPTDLIGTLTNIIRAKETDHLITATHVGGFGPKTYAWSTVGPATGVTLTNANTRTVTFRATTTGVYELQCIITDLVDTATDTMLVRVTELPPEPSSYFLWDGDFWIPQTVTFL